MAKSSDQSVAAISQDYVAKETYNPVRKERIINRFAKVTQFLTWPILFVIAHLFFKLTITGRENFDLVRRPFLIISNHISFYDSFLFRLVLGAWTPHLPLRFMAVRKFEWRSLNFLASIGVIDFIYSLFGVFTVVPGRGIRKNLEVATKIVEVGGDIVIYPEGRIFVPKDKSEGAIGPFKKGAFVLMMETCVPVVPIAFRVRPGFVRRGISVNVGKPMKVIPGKTAEDHSVIFHDAVRKLYDGA